jgi:hypothetical protein
MTASASERRVLFVCIGCPGGHDEPASQRPTLPSSAARHQHWQLGFPAEDLAAMRVFCEQVDQRVQALLADLQPPTR